MNMNKCPYILPCPHKTVRICAANSYSSLYVLLFTCNLPHVDVFPSRDEMRFVLFTNNLPHVDVFFPPETRCVLLNTEFLLQAECRGFGCGARGQSHYEQRHSASLITRAVCRLSDALNESHGE